MKNIIAEGAEATPEVSVRYTISSVFEDCQAHSQQHFKKRNFQVFVLKYTTKESDYNKKRTDTEHLNCLMLYIKKMLTLIKAKGKSRLNWTVCIT